MIIQPLPYPDNAFPIMGALVRKNAGQTVGTGLGPLLFQEEVYDIGGFHDNVTNTGRLTIDPAVGPATVRVVSGFRHTSTNNCYATHFINGGYVQGIGNNANAEGTNVGFALRNIASAPINAVDNDYFTIEMQLSTGTTTPNDDGRTFHSIEVVDPSLARVVYPLSAAQPVVANVAENLVWGAATFEQGGFTLADAGESIVVPETGRYRVTANALSGNVAGVMYLRVFVNGAAVTGCGAKSAGVAGQESINIVSAPLQLNAGDEIQISVTHTTSNTMAVHQVTFASVERVPDSYTCVLLGRNSGTQTIPAADTPVEWQVAAYEDVAGLWDVSAPTVVVAPFDGYYRQTFSLQGSNVANAFAAWGDLAGAVPYGVPGCSADNAGLDNICGMGAWIPCTAGQNIRLIARSVTSRTIGATGHDFMSVEFRQT